ncbi:MAG: hypothetical protein IIW54_16725, partial [Lachnospiraceae bacterium]|nr:hypothetical protein [Lachnospiraceae bacterium]
MKVTATEMYTSLKVIGDEVVLTNNNYFENWYGDLMPMELAYAIFPTNEYTVESFAATNPAGYSSTFKYEVGFYYELGTVRVETREKALSDKTLSPELLITCLKREVGLKAAKVKISVQP